jgi:hypothetical protein
VVTEKQVNEWLTENPVTQQFLTRLGAISAYNKTCKSEIPTFDKDELFRLTAFYEGMINQVDAIIDLSAEDILREEEYDE